MPSTTRNEPGSSSSSDPATMREPISATFSSSTGSMPRTTLPRTPGPEESIAWAFTNGAAATTWGLREASSAAFGQSASRPPWPLTCTCEATPRIRALSSLWKPFITDSTTISAATPRPMPSIETSGMNETKRLRRLARR
jgi:hypothetical protein